MSHTILLIVARDTNFCSRQTVIYTASDDGSADGGVTVVDSPTNCKSQSSPITKKESSPIKEETA